MKVLIMCTSPLQILIAEKIISKNNFSKFDLIYVAISEIEKQKYYFDKLAIKADQSYFHIFNSTSNIDHIINLMEFKKIIKSKFNGNYSAYYLASVDSIHFGYVLSKKNNNSKIYTFDDGLANIIKSSIYYSYKGPKFWKRIFLRIFGIKYFKQDILNSISMHYTLYKNQSNIINNTCYVEMFNFNKKVSFIKNGKKIKIFLGQPLYSINKKFDNDYISLVLENLKIDMYFPHPKEKYSLSNNFRVIKTNLIIEDYLIELIEKNIYETIEVYSFFSGALINIKDLPSLKVKYVYDKTLYNIYNEFYIFAHKKLNIENIDLECI